MVFFAIASRDTSDCCLKPIDLVGESVWTAYVIAIEQPDHPLDVGEEHAPKYWFHIGVGANNLEQVGQPFSQSRYDIRRQSTSPQLAVENLT